MRCNGDGKIVGEMTKGTGGDEAAGDVIFALLGTVPNCRHHGRLSKINRDLSRSLIRQRTRDQLTCIEGFYGSQHSLSLQRDGLVNQLFYA